MVLGYALLDETTMKKLALTAIAAAIGLTSLSAQAADFVAGKDYTVLANPEKIEGNKIIVREFFGTVARIAIS